MNKQHRAQGQKQASALMGGSRIGALILAVASVAQVGCQKAAPSRQSSPGATGNGSGAKPASENVASVSQTMTETYRTIRTVKDGRCLDLPNANSADATQYQSWQCIGDSKQQFDVTDVGAGKHQIENLASNKCLWVLDAQDGRRVEQRACNSSDNNQLWQLTNTGSNEYEIRNVGTNTCMDLTEGITKDGAPIQAWTCYQPGNNGANQRFHIPVWTQDFADGFDGSALDTSKWQDQLIWDNEEEQCNLGASHPSRGQVLSVGGGQLNLRLKKLGGDISCSDNVARDGRVHPDTPYVSARIVTKNKAEHARGRWVAKIKLSASAGTASGQAGMAPQFALWGERNNQAPIADSNWENVCWPNAGSGAIIPFLHSGADGADQYGASGVVSNGMCGEGDWWSRMAKGTPALDDWFEFGVQFVGDDMYYTYKDLRAGSPSYGVETFIGQHVVADTYPENMFAILSYGLTQQGTMTGEWAMHVDYMRHYSLAVGQAPVPTLTKTLKNVANNQYAYRDGSVIKYTSNPDAYGAAAQWNIEDYEGSKRLRNAGNQCLAHIENLLSYVQCDTSTYDTWTSNRWAVTMVGSNYVFSNLWQNTEMNLFGNPAAGVQCSERGTSSDAQWIYTPAPVTLNKTLRNVANGQYAYRDGAAIKYTATPSAYGSAAQWDIEDYAGSKRLRNVGNGCLAHIENQLSYVQCDTSTYDTWTSNRWAVTMVGSNYVFSNLWQNTEMNLFGNPAAGVQCTERGTSGDAQWMYTP